MRLRNLCETHSVLFTLHDRANLNNRSLSKGIRRKIVTNRYITLDFKSGTNDFY